MEERLEVQLASDLHLEFVPPEEIDWGTILSPAAPVRILLVRAAP